MKIEYNEKDLLSLYLKSIGYNFDKEITEEEYLNLLDDLDVTCYKYRVQYHLKKAFKNYEA